MTTAVDVVFEATGEGSLWLSPTGLRSDEDALLRVMERAHLEPQLSGLHGLAFVDRHGDVHAPTEAAVVLAKAFAAAEPESVTMYLEAQEAELRAEGYIPGERFSHDYLRRQRPGFALARQWAGFEREVESLREEIARLHALLGEAASALREAGADRLAMKLERAASGR